MSGSCVCQSMHLGVTSIQRVDNKYDQDVPYIHVYFYPVKINVFDFGLNFHLLSKLLFASMKYSGKIR